MVSLGFPIYRSMPFTKLFPNYITFLSFSCLIAVTKATNIMLEKRARVNILILFFTLMENFQVFTCIMLTMIYIHRLYHVDACSLCTHIVDSFHSKWMLGFFQEFCCIHWDDYMIFICHFLSGVPHWFIFRYWTILASLERILLDYGIHSF